MNIFFPPGTTTRDQIQSRLLQWAALSLAVYSLILTLSPAVRLHSWQVAYRWPHWLGFLVWLVGFAAIHRLSLKHLPDRDPYLLPVLALLTGLGVLTIWRLDGNFGARQTIWLALSQLFVSGLLLRPSLLLFLRRYKYVWLTGGLLLTAFTFIFGTYPGGSGPHLWLGCCGVYLQPSEPLKLLLVIYLAAYLADHSILNFRLVSLLLPTLILFGTALAILVAQRDLGTATIFIVLYSLMVYLTSGKKRILAISAIVLLLSAVIGYQLFGVIQIRVNTWLNPWSDPNGTAYQVIQSLIAVATGGIFGHGPGIGNPSIVPVAHSDFIFAAISEELGLVGVTAMIILYGMIIIRGFIAALYAPNLYQRFLAAGITTNIIAQGILIMGGNLRLLPLTGVTLPFLSYGGSSLVTSILSVALLWLISNHAEEERSSVTGSRPFLVTGALLLTGLAAVGSIAFYWGMLRANNLQNRADNPRWMITERYVARGRIVDRNNQPIAVTIGLPGALQRELLHIPLAPVIGYSKPLYGQAGLEAFLDPYLRGVQGNPTATTILSNLLYGQTPPGLDVRLSLDLRIQQSVDSLLADQAGALVLMNAQTGEIYAMASHPGYDPNQLAANWSEWVKDPRAVFLNRATQGQYSPGTALAPFLLANMIDQNPKLPLPESQSIVFDGVVWNCALPVSDKPTWGELVSHGCPGAANALAQLLRSDQLLELLNQVGLDRAPAISLPVASASILQMQDSSERLALGEGEIKVSPLQMALAISALNSDGDIPAARIAMAVKTPREGWVILPGATTPKNVNLAGRLEASQMLKMNQLPAWQVTATAPTEKGKISWFLAGTSSDWQGAPVSLALILEKDDPQAAQKIGEEVLQLMLLP